jgi:hypothetical protein
MQNGKAGVSEGDIKKGARLTSVYSHPFFRLVQKWVVGQQVSLVESSDLSGRSSSCYRVHNRNQTGMNFFKVGA